MDVDPRYKDIEKFRGDLSWYMIESIGFFSNISFKMEKERN